ncbi:MAG: thioredoxin domain-containing protein [Chitinophagaceae bacterium]
MARYIYGFLFSACGSIGKRYNFPARICLGVVLSLVVQRLSAQKTVLLDAPAFAREHQAHKGAVVLDARSGSEFEENHIPDARLLALPDKDTLSFIRQWDTSRIILLYSIANGRSVQWAGYLRAHGYAHAYALDGGLGAWVGAGYAFYASNAANNWNTDSLDHWKKNGRLLLVDVGSRHCAPCRRLKTVLDKIAGEEKDAFSLRSVDLNDNPALVGSIGGVDALPTLILYQNGKQVWRQKGIGDFATIEKRIREQIDAYK